MTKFSANLSTLFTEHPLIERFELAAKAGFKAIEIQFPYSLTKQEIKQQLDRYQLTLNLINLPGGDLANGDLGISCLPDRIQEFQLSVAQAHEYAEYLNIPKLNCLSGKKPIDLAHSLAESTFLKNIDYAASYLKKFNICLLIEPINTQDVPNFFLNNSAQASKLINKLANDNIKLQYDLYHMQIMEGNLIQTMTKLKDVIGHIQIADVPNRGEPGSGEINFSNIFNALAILGYTDYIGLEYFPIKNTQNGLDEIAPLLNLKGELT